MSTDEELRISHSGMVVRSPEGHAARGMQIRGNEDVWIEIQAHTFRNWVNEKLLRTGHQVENLTTDLMDGVALVRLVEVLQKRRLKLIANPFNQHQCLANVSEALKAVEEDGVRLVNIGNVDIVNGNQKLILGLIWSLIVRYQIGQSKFPPKKLMLSWLKTALPGRHVDNFTTDWNSGVNLSALLDFCQPGLVPDWHLLNPSNGVENNRKAMKLAKVHFGVPMVLDPEYLSSPYLDELSGMTYLSYFMGIDGPGYRKALDWVRAQLPEETIDNFTTDWNDGFLAAKLAVLHGAQIDLARDLDSRRHFWQNNWQTVIDACSQLGVEPHLMSAKDLSAPDVDYIGPMSYTSNFHWLPRRPPLSRQQPTFSPLQDRQRSPSPPPAPLPPFPRPSPAPVASASLTCPSRIGRINRTYEFRVDGVRGEDLQVEVRGPGSILDTRQRMVGDAAHVEFEPQHMGMHQIEVRCGAEPVANAPGLVRVLPEMGAMPEQCGIEPCAVGSTVEVNINPSEVSDGTIRVTAFSPWHRPLNCPVSCSDQGVYSATFQPDQVGEWKIQITYNDQHISGSPFSCFVFDPNAVRVGELQGSRPGEPFSFLLDTRDAGWGRVQADIVWNGRSLMHQLRPLSDNVYRVSVTPPEYGKYRVYVYFNGLEMKDNPFKLRVDRSGYHSLTRRSNRMSTGRTSTPLASQRMGTSSIHRSWNRDTSTTHGEVDHRSDLRSAAVADDDPRFDLRSAIDRSGDDYVVETTHYSSIKKTKTTERLEPYHSNTVVYSDSMNRKVGRSRSNIGSSRKNASLSNRASDRLNDNVHDTNRITYEHANCGYCNGYARQTSNKSRQSSSEKENISRSRRTHRSGDDWRSDRSRVMSPERSQFPSTLQRVSYKSDARWKPVSDDVSSLTRPRGSKTKNNKISDSKQRSANISFSTNDFDDRFYDSNAAEFNSKKYSDLGSRSYTVPDGGSRPRGRSPARYRTSFVTTIGAKTRSPVLVSNDGGRLSDSASLSQDRTTDWQYSESPRRSRTRESPLRYSSLSPQRQSHGDHSQFTSHKQKRHYSATRCDSDRKNRSDHGRPHSTLESSSLHSMRRKVLKEHREYRVNEDSTSSKKMDVSMKRLDLNGHPRDFSNLDLSPRLGTPPPDQPYDQDAHIKHIIRSARHDFDPASSNKIHVPKSGRNHVTSPGQNSVRFSPLPAKRQSKDVASESTSHSRLDKSVSLAEDTTTTHSGRKTLHSTVVSQNYSALEEENGHDSDEEDAESTVHVPVCVPAKFAFQAPADVHLRHLDASIIGPSGKELDCDIETDGKEFVISYTPNEVGEHEIHVLVKETAVADSPFRVSVYDAANIAVEDISDAHIGQHVQIKIDGSRAGSGNLEISVNGGHVSSYVRDLGHHKFVASFVPHQAGEHTVDMTFNGHPVPGSPWVVNVTDHSPVKTEAMGSTGAVNVSIDHLRHFSSTNAVSFDIHAAGRQITDITVDIIGPSKCSVGHKLSRENSAPEGTYQCSFNAQEVGTYNVHVIIDKKQVSGSPFVCKCYNAGLINVSDIPTGVVGQACQFRVDASQAGEGQLEISINDGEVPNHVQVLGGGRCLVTFTPELARAHTVQIKFNGRAVPGSPFTCHVQPSSRVSLSLRHLELLPVGRPASFVIGVDGSGGSAELAVSVRGPAHTTLPVTVAGSVRAGFTAEFTPQQLGAHTVLVEYNGTPVSGTPFTSKVYDASRVAVSDIPTADIGKTLQFTVDASEAGEGNLEIAIGAGGRNIPTQVHPQGAARFGVSFVPLEPVDHVINVSFNKQPIPGSPFTAYVQSDPNHIVVKGAALASTGVGKPSSFTLSNVTGNTTEVDVHIDGRHNTTKQH